MQHEVPAIGAVLHTNRPAIVASCPMTLTNFWSRYWQNMYFWHI